MAFKNKLRVLPGTMIYTGKHQKDTVIKHIQYSKDVFEVYDHMVECDTSVTDWIVVEGLTNTLLIQEIGEQYGFSPLVIEDVLHVNQRSKVEVFDDYMFVVFKYPYIQNSKIEHEDISIILSKEVVFTFTEQDNRFIEEIISRIQNQASKIRKYKQDYLFYTLFDIIIDETMEVYSDLEKRIEYFEERLEHLDMKNQKELYQIRKELVFINSMMTSLSTNLPKQFFESTDFFSNDLLIYFNDVQDHILNVKTRVLISIENVRNILDLYMNTISTKMNHIMTVLTIFSAIFIPLSFLAGVFGMNFVNFDILQNPNGILYFLALCVIISGSMLAFFKWKKWF